MPIIAALAPPRHTLLKAPRLRLPGLEPKNPAALLILPCLGVFPLKPGSYYLWILSRKASGAGTEDHMAGGHSAITPCPLPSAYPILLPDIDT